MNLTLCHSRNGTVTEIVKSAVVARGHRGESDEQVGLRKFLGQ